MSAERELSLRAVEIEPSSGQAGRAQSIHIRAAPARSRIVIGRYQGTVIVSVHGDLDDPGLVHLGGVLADLIDGQGNLSLLVDLHDAIAIDPEGVSVFAEAAERVHRDGGAITLSKPPGLLLEALRDRHLAHLVVTVVDQQGVD